MIVNRQNLTILNQAFNAAFKAGIALAKPMSHRIAMTVPSTTSEEKYAWLGMTTRFREWLGERQYQRLRQHDYSIKNKTFENSVEVERETIEDDQYGVFNPVIQQIGQDAALHPDELVFALLQAGFTTPCYDGQYFFDTDHPVGLPGSEASVSNFQGGSGTPWFLVDGSKVMKPIIFQKRRDYQFVSKTALTDENVLNKNVFQWAADARVNVGFGLWQLAYASRQPLDYTNYSAARAAHGSFKSDNGKPLAISSNQLWVGPSQERAALEVVKAERLANGASNVMQNTAEVIVCPWLA